MANYYANYKVNFELTASTVYEMYSFVCEKTEGMYRLSSEAFKVSEFGLAYLEYLRFAVSNLMDTDYLELPESFFSDFKVFLFVKNESVYLQVEQELLIPIPEERLCDFVKGCNLLEDHLIVEFETPADAAWIMSFNFEAGQEKLLDLDVILFG